MSIQIIAPGACVDEAAIRLSTQRLQQFAVQCEFSTHLFAQYRYLAGTAAQRLADLHAACVNPQIEAIWCGRGGTGAAQLLPYIDQWLIHKPIIGYSDNTVLLNEAARRGGKALHAPVFQEIATKNLNEISGISVDAQEVLALLNPSWQQRTHYPLSPVNTTAKSLPHLAGKTFGGNLTTLCSLQGTPWALTLSEPSILLLEDVGEPYYRLERLLVQLLQSVDVKQIQAIILGEFYQCPPKNVPHTLNEIFAEYCDTYAIPLYQGEWFGHGSRNRPFWIGAAADIQGLQLTI